MIIAMLAAAALAAPPAAPPVGSPEADPAVTIDALQQVYDESCGSRGYGQYDDICIQITQQIRRAEAELRRHPSPKASVQPSLTAPQSLPAPATPHADAPDGGTPPASLNPAQATPAPNKPSD